MRLEQLEYFLEVVSSKSINIAAENLYISQSALSRSIKSLEEELGCPLLLRKVDGVYLTTAGQDLLPFMREILQKVDALMNASQKYALRTDIIPSQEVSGQLNVFSVPIVADYLLFPAKFEFELMFPKVNVNIQTLDFKDPCQLTFPPSADLLVWLNIEDSLDTTCIQKKLYMESLFSDKNFVVVSKKHELARKKIVTLEEVLNYKLVAHHNGVDLDMFYSYFVKRSEPLDIIMKSNNNRILIETLLEQNAVLITSNLIVYSDFSTNEQLISIPLKNRKNTYFCLYDPLNPFSSIIKTFIDVLKSWYIKKMTKQKLPN